MPIIATPTTGTPLLPDAGAALAAAPAETLQALISGINGVSATLTRLAAERAAGEQSWQQALKSLRHANDLELRQRQSPDMADDGGSQLGRACAAVGEQRERMAKRLNAGGTAVRRAIRDELERRMSEADRAMATAQSEAAGQKRTTAVEVEALQQLLTVELDTLRMRTKALHQELGRMPRRAGLAAAEAAPKALPPAAATVLEEAERIRRALGEAEEERRHIRASWSYFSCRPLGMLLTHGLVALPHAVALPILPVVHQTHLVPLVALSGIAFQCLTPIITALRRYRVGDSLGALAAVVQQLPGRIDRLEEALRRRLGPPGPLQRLIDRLLALSTTHAEHVQQLNAFAEQNIMREREREQRLLKRNRERAVKAEATLRSAAAAAQEQLQAGLAADLARLRALHIEQRVQLDQGWSSRLEAIDRRAAEVIAEAQAACIAASARGAQSHPAWTHADWATWSPHGVGAERLPLGDAVIAVAPARVVDAAGEPGRAPARPDQLRLPVTLALPEQPALVTYRTAAGRAAAINLVVQLVLRALTAIEPGQLRLTLIDPLGLGANFAGLLELADHDDALLGDGVLGDPERIDRGLDDLTLHIEGVIRHRLRGRYPSIAEYNRAAGDLREPLRLVVALDFPNGFGENACERLATLAASGPRCGVQLVLIHDERKAWPAAIEQGALRDSGIILREQGAGFAIDHPGCAGWGFIPEALPRPGLSTRLLTTIGLCAKRARRISVAFSSVAPPLDQLWSKSSARDLRIPIGSRGADRQQFLELGHGTAQHVLVGGRTGSGKSTLFHVLITNAALWYGPQELELHLIDFKKGVEFKAFATLRLPHARVIAIESDREFGLSVLRNLDQELSRRGAMFRRAGVQDLAAHRATGGEHLPRVLLLIDEFQEFFTEDDGIARDAALVLDRLVRQGRAFGVHVVLGSQTLGGAYALAKSSLGQMGIRIALPCGEADAHLLLHTDNDAARHLSRSGDAIYNDHAGLVEGNSPFQVCWLPEEEESAYLRQIAAKTAACGWTPAAPGIIFEGNQPSQLEEARELNALLAQPLHEEDALTGAWIGQSSSLNGAAGLTLARAAGGNLLLVGQQRDAAVGICAAWAIGLCARHRPGGFRLLAIDGEDRDGPFARCHDLLASALPHSLVRHPAGAAAEVIGALCAELERRTNGSESARSPVVLTLFALQRLRQVRPQEDIDFRRSLAEAPAGEPLADQLARLLAHGPDYGMHVIAWSDSLASLQRNLGRRSLRDFDQRILFQQSAADSTELMDDDSASKLGLNTALVQSLGEGRREKIRPFAVPDAELVAQFGKRIRARLS